MFLIDSHRHNGSSKSFQLWTCHILTMQLDQRRSENNRVKSNMMPSPRFYKDFFLSIISHFEHVIGLLLSVNTKGFDPCNASLKDSAQYCCLEPFRPAFVYWWLCDLNHGPVFQCRYSLSIQDFFNATISWLWVLLPHDLISIHLSSLLLRIILKQ